MTLFKDLCCIHISQVTANIARVFSEGGHLIRNSEILIDPVHQLRGQVTQYNVTIVIVHYTWLCTNVVPYSVWKLSINKWNHGRQVYLEQRLEQRSDEMRIAMFPACLRAP